MTQSHSQLDYIALLQSLSKEQQQQIAYQVALFNSDLPKSKLEACIISVEDKYPDLLNIKQYLLDKLPAHFIPTSINVVHEIPRASHGKIARNILPKYPWNIVDKPERNGELDISSTQDSLAVPSFEAPNTEIEKILAQIWCDVLGVGEISVHDSFIEVGGDSLLSIRILSRIKSAGFNIKAEEFFDLATIYQQANWLQSLPVDKVTVEEKSSLGIQQIGKGQLAAISKLLDDIDDD